MPRSRSVQSLHVSRISESVLSATVQTWPPASPFRSARQSVSSLLSRSVSPVHSLRCVRSIRVVLPVTISLRVFPVSRSFSRHVSPRDSLSSQSSAELYRSKIQRRSVRSRSFLTTRRIPTPRPTLSLTDQGSRLWTDRSSRRATSSPRVRLILMTS